MTVADVSAPGALSVAAVILAAATGAHAQQRVPCGDGTGLIAHLEKEWGEEPSALALDASGRMVRILVNPQTGTWSLLVTGPGGPTCLIQHGTAWEPAAQPAEPGDPS